MRNVFVLCTGRCGSLTFTRAASHITNYTAGHETRSTMVGPARLAYPANHIEVDNRLSWALGRLENAYGSDARYVHLVRDPEEVARSFGYRWGIKNGIISAYRDGILKGSEEGKSDICRDYVETVTANIEAFLKDKPQKMKFDMKSADSDWRKFWDWVGAEGDFEASLQEWSVTHNATGKRARWLGWV